MPKHINFLENFYKSHKIEKKQISIKTKSGETSFIYTKSIKNKKTILFIHGLGNDKYYPFIELFTSLLQEGFSIISLDLTGHGIGNTSYFALDSTTEAIFKTINYAKKSLKIEKNNLILLGHSFGGFLCLLESQKNSCGGIITISAPCEIKINFLSFLELLLVARPATLKQLRYYSLPWLIVSFGIFRQNKYPLRIKSKHRLQYLSKLTNKINRINLLEKIKKSKLPYLQIHSRADLIIPFQQAIEIRKAYNGIIKFVPLNFQTHLTTIFSKKVTNSILSWLK